MHLADQVIVEKNHVDFAFEREILWAYFNPSHFDPWVMILLIEGCTFVKKGASV